jgi:hypothetical protein
LLGDDEADAHADGDGEADGDREKQVVLRGKVGHDGESDANEDELGQKFGGDVGEGGGDGVGDRDAGEGDHAGADDVAAHLAKGQEFAGGVAHQPAPDEEPEAAFGPAAQEHAPAEGKAEGDDELRADIGGEAGGFDRGEGFQHVAGAEINDQPGYDGDPGEREGCRE